MAGLEDKHATPRAMSPMMHALKQFDAAEANLIKVERLWTELQELAPQGASIGGSLEYEDRSRSFELVLAALPKIDGWKPDLSAHEPTKVRANRFELSELCDTTSETQSAMPVWQEGRQIREYRFRLHQKRRALIRAIITLT